MQSRLLPVTPLMPFEYILWKLLPFTIHFVNKGHHRTLQFSSHPDYQEAQRVRGSIPPWQQGWVSTLPSTFRSTSADLHPCTHTHAHRVGLQRQARNTQSLSLYCYLLIIVPLSTGTTVNLLSPAPACMCGNVMHGYVFSCTLMYKN